MHILAVLCLLIGFSTALTAAPTPQSVALSEKQMQSLRQGKLEIREIAENNKGRRFEVYAIINAQPQKVLDALLDYEHYPEFMPNVKRVDIVEQTADHNIINQTLGLPLGKIKRYRLENHITRNADSIGLAWRMLPWPELPADERIGDTSGYWILQAQDENHTLVVYHIYTDPGDVPFGLGWIVDLLSTKSVPDVVENTRNYVQRK
ncbi:MAG: hypothetical protein OEZ43_00445 [Gammaproteobacteria bacterium]|nr:hypothetical protein [Gammaproteobacteria bacterium]